jgi:peptidoglycan/LPS O-acetylase OafA/YrhL
LLLLAGILAWRWWFLGFDDLTLLAATVIFAVLGNAVVCAVISGPHDRYGARMAWIATFVVLVAAIRSFSGDDERRSRPG